MCCFPTEPASRHPTGESFLFALWEGPSTPRRCSTFCSGGLKNYRSEGLQDRDEPTLYRGMEAGPVSGGESTEVTEGVL